ncbi:MAG: GWxTD domain-containing protein [Spirosomataceae bacterium]
MKKIVLALVGVVLLAGCVSKKKLSQFAKNESQSTEKVEKGGITSVKSKFLDNGTSLRVFMNIEVERLPKDASAAALFSKEFTLSYSVFPDYSAKQQLGTGAVMLSTQNVVFDEDHLVVQFDVPKPKEVYTAVVLMQLADLPNQKNFTTDLFVRFQSGKVGDYFTFFDKTGQFPQLRSYLFTKDTFMLRDIGGTSRKMLVLRYKHEFDPALPPMSTTPRAVTKALYLDTLFTVETNKPIVLKDEALYYFCRDTTESYGIGVMGVDKRYPRITRPERLARPPIYISTSAEINDLLASADYKRSLDRYWLGLTSGNQAVAKRNIKNYYRRVEQANKQFTTYKEGWKTDKGMVFIIMGQPDKVQRTKDKEIWTYSRKGQFQEVNFTFTKRPNQFVEDHYELSRYVEYQPIWFPMVEAWRTGEVEK